MLVTLIPLVNDTHLGVVSYVELSNAERISQRPVDRSDLPSPHGTRTPSFSDAATQPRLRFGPSRAPRRICVRTALGHARSVPVRSDSRAPAHTCGNERIGSR